MTYIKKIEKRILELMKPICNSIINIDYSGTNWISIDVQSLEEIDSTIKLIKNNKKIILNGIREILKDSKYKDDWTIHCITHVYSIDEENLSKLTRSKKNAIFKLIKKDKRCTAKPEYIFAHSSEHKIKSRGPGYYIVFDHNDSKNEINKSKKIITNIIKNYFTEIDAKIVDRIDINFSDTNNPNLYGMSRED